MRIDANKKFKENDKRLEQLITVMHQRFEENDKRWEENNKRLDALIKEMHQRFEDQKEYIDNRFDEF